MGNLDGILISILPPIILLALGALARKAAWLRAEADASLSMVTIRILYPCFIFYHILGSKEVIVNASTLLTPAYGFASIFHGIACILHGFAFSFHGFAYILTWICMHFHRFSSSFDDFL